MATKNDSIHLKQMQSSHVVFISAINAAPLLFQFDKIRYFLTKHLSFPSGAAVVSLNRFTMGLVIEQLHINCNLPKKIEKNKTLKSSPSTLHHQRRHVYNT